MAEKVKNMYEKLKKTYLRNTNVRPVSCAVWYSWTTLWKYTTQLRYICQDQIPGRECSNFAPDYLNLLQHLCGNLKTTSAPVFSAFFHDLFWMVTKKMACSPIGITPLEDTKPDIWHKTLFLVVSPKSRSGPKKRGTRSPEPPPHHTLPLYIYWL